MAIPLKFSKSDSAVPWGFRLVGGVDFDQPIVVVKVNENSLAESAGLEEGDIIVRVNDTPTAGLTHNEVHDLLFSAGLEFELGIRRGDIMTRIISDEEYSIEESNAIKKAIEEEIINEAIVRLNNLKNSIDTSEQQARSNIIENLSGQEEIINTVTLQTTSDVKKGKKWSTFLTRPDKPVPKEKKKVEEEKMKGDPYRVVIKKQTRRPSQEKKVQFDQNVTEVEVDFESEETEDITNEDDKKSETIDVEDKVDESEDITIEGTRAINDDTEGDRDTPEEEESKRRNKRDSVEMEHERFGTQTPEEKLEISHSLEEQLLAVQKQLEALSQLPSTIQLTLDAVSKQLANIVGARENAERNVGQGESTTNSKDDEEERHTEEEYLEDPSLSEKAEAELFREDSEANSSIGEELEEDGARQEDMEEREEVNEKNEEREPSPSAGLTDEEREAQVRKEQLEAKRQKTMEEGTLKPIQRPIILPGGRKWSNPEDAIPSFRKPKMSEDKIIETIDSNLEVIIGKRKGESNCWKVPSRATTTEGINFLKYQPPPKNLDYLQKSEVYRLVHDMEPPVRGIVSRAERVPAMQDYYEATTGAP